MARIPKKLPGDVNARAVAIARIGLGEDDDNVDNRPVDEVMGGRRKAASGGKARASNLTPKRRREIATKAAAARWRSGRER